MKASTFVTAKRHFTKMQRDEDKDKDNKEKCLAGKSAKRFAANIGDGVMSSNDAPAKLESNVLANMLAPLGIRGCKNIRLGGETLKDVSGELCQPDPDSTGRGRGAKRNWGQFWQTYRQINPSFELFAMADADPSIDLNQVAAFFIHGDEGRTLKRGGLLVTSLQSALGKGYDENRVAKVPGSPALQVNFAGHSFCTRHVISAIPKTCYDCQPEAYHSHMEHVAKSCSKLLHDGYVDKASGLRYRVCILGVKGDQPYLQKVGHFYRAWNTQAKRGEERGPPKGCCPYCLAGTRLCHAEEIATTTPKWLQTVAVKLPWVRQPAVIRHLCHDQGDPADFFKSDIWHVVHLGFGRSWVASVLQVCLPLLPMPNLDEKWNYLTEEYLDWCAANRKQAHISRITPYLMSYGQQGGAMGSWYKGALTTIFLHWLVDFLGKVPNDPDGHIMQCHCATYRLNSMFSMLYKAGAFLSEEESQFVSEQGLRFLESYSLLAHALFMQGKQQCFPLYPKLHTFHHIVLEVRVSARSLDRFLVASYTAFVKAGLLQ
ncbi:unnamed protein product [Cladocopium goreaui]|uniref:Uncharacterized protein n=1 Tax=Cladocopium goreaui TaxID=2562237 RepID=A0A9P1GSD6_9DINO|nr:unnamed protein product [Cladocopium goreaui]